LSASFSALFEDFHPPHPDPPALFSPYLNFVSSSLASFFTLLLKLLILFEYISVSLLINPSSPFTQACTIPSHHSDAVFFVSAHNFFVSSKTVFKLFLYSSVLFLSIKENCQTSSFFGRMKFNLSQSQLIELKTVLIMPIKTFSTSVFNFKNQL